jgi:pimeloyl-ACP methyl ester carboxylesterase
MATHPTEGFLVNFRSAGDGRNIVLIHGLASNRGFWNIKVLLPLIKHYRVTTYDLRGHGYSGMPLVGYTPEDMASDLHHLLDHLGIEQAHLVGHSFGGVVALQYAILHPERVMSLIIADSRIRSFQEDYSAAKWQNWERARKTLERIDLVIPEDETEAGIWLLEKLASPEWRHKRSALEGTPLFLPFSKWSGGTRAAERWLQLINNTRARQELVTAAGMTIEALSKIQQPSLVMYGEYSPALPSGQALERLMPACQMWIIPQSGHFFPFTQAGLFVESLLLFLNKVHMGRVRKQKRLPAKFPVLVQTDAEVMLNGMTLNVSAGGLLVSASRGLRIGADIRITFPGISDRLLYLTGKVARSGQPMDDPLCFGVALSSKIQGQNQWIDILMSQLRIREEAASARLRDERMDAAY